MNFQIEAEVPLNQPTKDFVKVIVERQGRVNDLHVQPWVIYGAAGQHPS